MTPVRNFVPDYWLICSESAYYSLASQWRQEAGAGSLLDWRLNQGLIEEVSANDVCDRTAQLADTGASCITVIVDEATVDMLAELEELSKAVTIHVAEWRNEPLAVVLSMNAPDRALIYALQGLEVPANLHSFGSPAIPNFFEYKEALKNWEADCRSIDIEEFAEVYPNFAEANIPWLALVCGPANDNAWVPLKVLAAASERNVGGPFRVEEPDRQPARWDLTWAPESGAQNDRGLLRFKVSDESISAFAGRRVWVKYLDREIDLGVVDDRGRAAVVLDHPVDMANLSISIVPVKRGQ